MNRKVVVLVDDLFWRSKIEHAVGSAGQTAEFLTGVDAVGKLAAADVSVLLVDLALRQEPFTALAALKKDAKRKAIPVIGFYEHVRKDLREKAEAAGCDEVLPRSAFATRLAEIVMKYALPGAVKQEEEETEIPEE